MLAKDKSTVWNLLKTAADYVYGVSAPEFSGEVPTFTDDVALDIVPNEEPQKFADAIADGATGNAAPRETAPNSARATNGISATDEKLLKSAAMGNDALDSAANNMPTAVGLRSDTNESRTAALAKIAKEIAACSRCALCERRTNVVPGMGAVNPAVLVVGEGPGAEEDAQGLPFVGPAGKLLDKMLAAISLDRNVNCYIANVVKCRPPGNRTPFPAEGAACMPYLEAQMSILKPAMILAAGRTAAQNLLRTTEPLGRLRGTFRDVNGVPLLVTYHPSALLRDESLKRPAWEDLKLFRARLETLVPDYAQGFVKP